MNSLRRTLTGYAFGWPWFDGVSVWALRRLFFPVSRLWAAAQLADGSPGRFSQGLQLPRRLADGRRLASALAKFERARARAQAAEAAWQTTFFGAEDGPVAQRIAAETERLEASQAYNTARRHFAWLLWHVTPPIRLSTEHPDTIAQAYGETREDFARACAAPAAMPTVQVSRAIPTAVGNDFWLRFRSPSARLADTAYARVHEPSGVADPPTLILGHGICVEFDHWRGLIDEAETLCAAGFRVIRPEAPWHGRRTPRGFFGGERLVSIFPTGLFDAFAGAIAEWSVLADWSRKTSRGPVAFGGTSLGAQIAQLAADFAADGPERLRPDGMFLVTHCGRMADATLRGEMGRVLGRAQNMRGDGWTPELFEARLAWLDPRTRAPVAPARIVTVLGNLDSVTPYESAAALIDSWGVPEENRFIWPRGHFSMPMTLIRDRRAVERFRVAMETVRR